MQRLNPQYLQHSELQHHDRLKGPRKEQQHSGLRPYPLVRWLAVRGGLRQGLGLWMVASADC